MKIGHIIFAFFPGILSLLHETKKWYTNIRNSSDIIKETRTTAPRISAFPLHVPDHYVQEPTHHPGCQLRSPPPPPSTSSSPTCPL